MKTEGTQGMNWTVLLLSLLVIYALMPDETCLGAPKGAFQNQSIQTGGPKQPQPEKSCGTGKVWVKTDNQGHGYYAQGAIYQRADGTTYARDMTTGAYLGEYSPPPTTPPPTTQQGPSGPQTGNSINQPGVMTYPGDYTKVPTQPTQSTQPSPTPQGQGTQPAGTPPAGDQPPPNQPPETTIYYKDPDTGQVMVRDNNNGYTRPATPSEAAEATLSPAPR